MFIKIFAVIFSFSLICYSQDFSIENDNYLHKEAHVNVQTNKTLDSINTRQKFVISLPLIGVSLGLTGLLLVSDDESYEIFKSFRDRNNTVSKFSPIITQLGDGKFSLALFGTMGIFHFITGDKNSGKAAILGLESFLLSGLTVQILKHTFGRERPSNRSMDGGKWHGPFIYHRNSSLANFDAFPSGHTATIFAAATTLSLIYPDGIVPYISYGIASVVALSRVTESTHWLSDCLIGGLIGYFSTRLIYFWQDQNPRIQFLYNYKKIGVSISYQLN